MTFNMLLDVPSSTHDINTVGYDGHPMKANEKEVCRLIERGGNGSMSDADSGQCIEESHDQLWADNGELRKTELETDLDDGELRKTELETDLDRGEHNNAELEMSGKQIQDLFNGEDNNDT